jgi:hypothetical protein
MVIVGIRKPAPVQIKGLNGKGVISLPARVCAHEVRQAVKHDLPHAALSFD